MHYLSSFIFVTGTRHQTTKIQSVKIQNDGIQSRENHHQSKRSQNGGGEKVFRSPAASRRKQTQQDEQISKIASPENQDVRFSLNKKQRWEMVEKLREEEQKTYSQSQSCTQRSERIRQKFKGTKRKDHEDIQPQLLRDWQTEEKKEIVIEDNAFMISTDMEKYR